MKKVPEALRYEFLGGIDYTATGIKTGHLTDMENILKRRMPASEVNKVMTYISKKEKNVLSLPYREAYFYLDNDRYFVRVTEKEYVDTVIAPYVDVSLWYRTPEFVKRDEPLIMDYWQPIYAKKSNHVFR